MDGREVEDAEVGAQRHVEQLATHVHVPNFPIQPYRRPPFSGRRVSAGIPWMLRIGISACASPHRHRHRGRRAPLPAQEVGMQTDQRLHAVPTVGWRRPACLGPCRGPRPGRCGAIALLVCMTSRPSAGTNAESLAASRINGSQTEHPALMFAPFGSYHTSTLLQYVQFPSSFRLSRSRAQLTAPTLRTRQSHLPSHNVKAPQEQGRLDRRWCHQHLLLGATPQRQQGQCLRDPSSPEHR